MRKPSLPAGVCPVAAMLVAAVGFSAPAAVSGQEFRFDGGDWLAREVGREGSAIIVESEGPPMSGPREFYRPVPPLALDHRWLLVQDSTFGVVFTQPSGVKGEVDAHVADVYLRALSAVTAVELRALLFDVWGDPTGYVTATVLVERGAGEQWEVHPRWTDLGGPPHEHRTSIVWVNRVMFADQSILRADLGPIAEAWEYVTGLDFEGLTDGPPVRAVGQ